MSSVWNLKSIDQLDFYNDTRTPFNDRKLVWFFPFEVSEVTTVNKLMTSPYVSTEDSSTTETDVHGDTKWTCLYTSMEI